MGVLLLNNNRINRITSKLNTQIPNLEMLILTNNKIAYFEDISRLCYLEKLKYLSLYGNPISAHKDYRLYTISRCKCLKWLDFRKIKQGELKDAEDLFGGGRNPIIKS